MSDVFVTDFRLKYFVERTKVFSLCTHQLEPQMLVYKMQGAIMHLDLKRRTGIDVGCEVVCEQSKTCVMEISLAFR